jgi:hypothetical protein
MKHKMFVLSNIANLRVHVCDYFAIIQYANKVIGKNILKG